MFIVLNVIISGNVTVFSRLGLQGDQVQLISPLHVFETPTTLIFNYYLQSGGIGGALSLYQYSMLHVPVLLLFADSDNVNSVQTATVCLPNGTYSLLFLATIGQPYASDVSVDNVGIGGPCQISATTRPKGLIDVALLAIMILQYCISLQFICYKFSTRLFARFFYQYQCKYCIKTTWLIFICFFYSSIIVA